MLILAGVSLNAIVGDNGIITNAQNANMKNGMAALEEFLQEKYVENFDNFTSDDSNKVAKLSALYHEYFYNPQDDGFGTVNYILDAEGHALYLINKSGLPEDVQELLHAGNCGYGLEGADRYAAFARLEDVYGVTSSLKVYYVSGDGTFMGIASKNDLDDDTTSRVVLRSSNALAGAIKNDGSDVTVADIQSVKNLTINETNSISSLSDLYALGSLESLTLDGVTLNNLDGIQTAAKLSYVYIKNSIIDDGNDSTYKEYESLAKVAKLKYLYFYSVNDTDLEKICEGIKNANYPNLEYLAFMGRASYVCSTDDKINGARNSEKSLTNLLPLSKLSSSCVGNVKYLSIQSNDISDTTSVENGITITKYALENLVNFSDLYLLRVERNKLTSLKGLEDKSNLRYLYAGYNQ